ncbi:MAG: hypothetical protein HYY06_09040 [Deltaproteobacteria bacterium]|nr:hypothetical protein [Deltaproteobacteria bacterium]
MRVVGVVRVAAALSLFCGCSCGGGGKPAEPDGDGDASLDDSGVGDAAAHLDAAIDAPGPGDAAADAPAETDGATDAEVRPEDAATDAAPTDAATDAATDAGASEDAGVDAEAPSEDAGPACPFEGPCGPLAVCCGEFEACRLDSCFPSPACDDSDDCLLDERCVDGDCDPWDEGGSDDTCQRLVAVGRFRPTLQCEWTAPPEGDAYPANVHVLSTPAVVDFDLDGDPETLEPSIVFVTDDGVDGSSEQPTGVIRVIDGDTCAHQYTIDAHLTSHDSPPAVGDLDGDGRAEIVDYAAGGGLVAFAYDPAADEWDLMWHSKQADGVTDYVATGGGWAGPSIHDVDDDGSPEVLRGGVIFDADGVLVGGSLGYLAFTGTGMFPVVADVDLDGAPELVTGAGIWRFDPVGRDWAAEPYFATAQPDGHTAIGDFGDFPLNALDIPDAPEVVVVPTGRVRVQTIEGTVIFGPYDIPGGGNGGPPTIADFDGDGRAEFATAGLANYVVFDLDCVPGGGSGECGTGRVDGILWLKPSQDASSNRTGSSVFDFEGDGPAEAVYADECFVRVYQGSTGEVIFSQYHSSCTWYENPIVADTDGDYHAELVVPSNLNCSPVGCPTCGRPCTLNVDVDNVDQLFAGLRCEEDSECPTAGSTCNAGFCRCDADDDCCPQGGCTAAGWRCAAPPVGTPGAGNTCRARHPNGAVGLRVYSDYADRWVGSRAIWNQHAYAVTNVEDDGTIPRSSEVEVNWLTEGLDNFRQNVQGNLRPLDAPDLTAGIGLPPGCYAEDPTVTLTVDVCNRGIAPLAAGVPIAFFAGDPAQGAEEACRAETTLVLEAGECEDVSCIWSPVLTNQVIDIWVVADPDGQTTECFEENNLGIIPGFFCGD